MAAKLNQIIAVSSGKKSLLERAVTDAYQLLGKPALLEGIAKIYQPLHDDGEMFPPESKKLQVKVKDIVKNVRAALTELIDINLIQDAANCAAKADVTFGNVTIKDVPVTSLLFLEKRLTDFATFVEKLPTLDPGHDWSNDAGQDCYATAPVQTAKTKKLQKPLTLAQATPEHPAQVQLVTEDVLTGYWTTRLFSGAIPSQQRNQVLGRVREIRDALKMARESANSIEVVEKKIGDDILKYALGDL